MANHKEKGWEEDVWAINRCKKMGWVDWPSGKTDFLGDSLRWDTG
jgi:hypothetical protein